VKTKKVKTKNGKTQFFKKKSANCGGDKKIGYL